MLSTRIRPLPSLRSSLGNRKAAGSSKPPMRNMARPRSAAVPPRLRITFTRKLDRGSTAVRPKSTPASMRVNRGLLRSRERADWGRSAAARPSAGALGCQVG